VNAGNPFSATEIHGKVLVKFHISPPCFL